MIIDNSVEVKQCSCRSTAGCRLERFRNSGTSNGDTLKIGDRSSSLRRSTCVSKCCFETLLYSMEKTCYKCRVAKPVTEFTNDKKTKDGYCRACKDCRREIRKKSYVKNNTAQKQTEARRRLQDWVCQFKTKCENCSETHPACLDFHHEGEKYAGLS